jgi:DNA-binding ferritin-like protein (Dps family)
MNFWEKITGSDMTKEFKAFDVRVKRLPADYQSAWGEIFTNLMGYSDFTGRNLVPIFKGVLDMLEETAAEGLSVKEVVGDDIKGFCSALAGAEGAKTYRDKWRSQLNDTIAKKLGR